jgi:hypothetical protein
MCRRRKDRERDAPPMASLFWRPSVLTKLHTDAGDRVPERYRRSVACVNVQIVRRSVKRLARRAAQALDRRTHPRWLDRLRQPERLGMPQSDARLAARPHSLGIRKSAVHRTLSVILLGKMAKSVGYDI